MQSTEDVEAHLTLTWEKDGKSYEATAKVKNPVMREWPEDEDDWMSHRIGEKWPSNETQYYLVFKPEEDGTQFKLKVTELSKKQVKKTAEIDVDTLNITNVLEAQRATGAPDDAQISVYKDHPNTKAATITFRWSENG